MTDILSKMPRVKYDQYLLTDLTTRAEIYRRILRRIPVFYNYTIKDGERPDTVAYDYYGSEDYTWLVMMSANIYSVYDQWPMPYQDFRSYLLKKYGNITTIMGQVHHYIYTGINGTDRPEDITRKSWRLTPTTYAALPTLQKSGWSPVTVYEEEVAVNEAKRTIKLLSNVYLDQINRELDTIFK